MRLISAPLSLSVFFSRILLGLTSSSSFLINAVNTFTGVLQSAQCIALSFGDVRPHNFHAITWLRDFRPSQNCVGPTTAGAYRPVCFCFSRAF